tara:strand:- start:6032 stop:6388 length:357 start_codon:yes stop_codon:yes gene_type:complete
MGDDGEKVAYFLALILLFGMIGPTFPRVPDDNVVNPFSCRDVEGTVVDKEHTDEGYILYVELTINNPQGYVVYVSNATYNNYEIGYTYQQRVCDLIEFTDMENTINDLVNNGWLIPTP